jgi:hypothetical protein
MTPDQLTANMSPEARRNFNETDQARSIRQVPRDLFEGALSLPSEMDRVEKEAIGYGKQFTSPTSLPGKLVRGYEKLANYADMGMGQYLPSMETVQKYDSALLGKPYESQTTTGKMLRLGLGAAAPLGVSKVTTLAREGVPVVKALKTAEELNQEVVQPAYQAAHDAGETVKPDQIKQMVSDVRQVANENYVSDQTFPRVNAILKTIEGKAPKDVPDWQQKMHDAFGTDLPPKAGDLPHMELDKYRSDLRRVGRESPNADERRVANEAADAVDESLDKQMAGSPHLKQARIAFREMKRSEALENLASDASLSERARNGDFAGALANALASKLKSNAAAQRWMRQFSPEQQAKLQSIVKDGGKNPKKIWNLLSQDKGFATTIAGYAIGGEAGALGVQAVKAFANYAKGAPNREMVQRFQELQRFVQGLERQGKSKLPSKVPGRRALVTNAAAVGMFPSAPPPVNPASLLPQDQEDLTPDATMMGIRG